MLIKELFLFISLFFFDLFSYELIFSQDRSISYQKKEIPGKVAGFTSVGEATYVMTYRYGLYKFDNNGYRQLKSPISPVFNLPRQLEGGDFSKQSPYLITRNKLVQLTNDSYTYLKLNGVRKGSRLASVSHYKSNLYLGTTYNGVYVQNSASLEWVNVSAGLPREKYAWKEYFYDDVNKLFVYENMLYAFCKFEKTLYFFEEKNNRWKKTSLSGIKEIRILNEIIYLKKNDEWFELLKNQQITLSKKKIDKKSRWVIKNGKLTCFGEFGKNYPYKNLEKYKNINKDIRSLYINLDFITYKEMDIVTNLLAKNIVNALVINFKDDTGNLTYGSKLPIAQKIGSAKKHAKFENFYRRIKKLNPYIIARLVVFKDYRAYRYNDNQYALRDKRTGEPWKVSSHEYWVDPYSSEIREYNLAIAKEIEERSNEFLINEIQFDYIRVPSDKEIRYVDFRYRKKGWERYDILESFLSKVTNTLTIPFSLDIYGYNGIYRMGNVIGQDIETISKYAPIICPMHYPSHFGPAYLNTREGAKEYNLLKFALEQANDIIYEGTIIRPYLQAFSYKSPDFGEKYIKDQVKGSLDGGAKGVGFWHPSSKYSLTKEYLEKIFSKYTK